MMFIDYYYFKTARLPGFSYFVLISIESYIVTIHPCFPSIHACMG
jgi:hypothetical protein